MKNMIGNKRKMTMIAVSVFFSALLIAADQIIKHIVSVNIDYSTESVKFIDDFFYIVHWHNTGAAWGAMSDFTWLLSCITVLASVGILYLMICSKNKLLCTAFVLTFSGAIGNVIDRIRLGYVVDYLHFNNIFGYDFPAFNLADVCIVSGCIGLIICLIFVKKESYFEENTVAAKFFADGENTDKIANDNGAETENKKE